MAAHRRSPADLDRRPAPSEPRTRRCARPLATAPQTHARALRKGPMSEPEIHSTTPSSTTVASASVRSASRPACWPSQAAGCGVCLPRRRHDAAVGHHGRQAPQGPLRLLPADDRRRGAHVRRGPHPRLVLPPRGPAERGRDPHLPPDRPPAAPDLQEGPAQRGPGRHHGPGAQPRHRLRRPRDQRRLGVDADLRPALHGPDRRHPRRADRRSVGRLPDAQRARERRVRHGRRGPHRR